MLNEPYSAEKQVNSYMEAAGLDSKAASEALTNSLAFAKGLGWTGLWPDIAALALFGPVLLAVAAALLRGQEK